MKTAPTALVSNATSGPLPDGLVRSAIACIAGVALACALLAVLVHVRLDLSAAYLAKVAIALAIAIALVLRGLSWHAPHRRFGPANCMTMARAALVALLAGLIGEGDHSTWALLAACAGVIAVLLDGLDGWLARRTALASPYGARFDMEADAALGLVLAILAWQFDRVPVWVLLLGLTRYLFVALGVLLPWLRSPLPASMRRKAICVVQLVALALVLWPALSVSVATSLAACALLALGYSFAFDSLWLYRHASVAGRRT